MITFPFSLSGKKILVTGASSGIGQSTAIECSRMGAKLIISARSEVRLNETFSQLTGDGHQIVVADLSRQEGIDAVMNAIDKVDGIATREKFDDIFNINFFSPVELLRLLYKKKKINTAGSVVVIASLGGTKIFSGGNSIYGASKAALNCIMKFCAKEFSSRKIRVNCICPGMVETPLIHRGTVSDEQLKENEKLYPLGRYGKPEEIAYSAVYLLSDATTWMTGQDIILDGGISIR